MNLRSQFPILDTQVVFAIFAEKINGYGKKTQ